MIDQYAVVGNPIAHSKSPDIHAAFARQVGHKLSYVRIEAPLADFVGVAEEFRQRGGVGMNVTAPFKLDAFSFATQRSTRATLAGAANTLCFQLGANGPTIYADNTDGVGLVNDLRGNLACELTGQRILLLGAGGAARGVLGALIDAAPVRLAVANRHYDKAVELVQQIAGPICHPAVEALELAKLRDQQFDIVINATSAGLSAQSLDVSTACFAPHCLAYDMTYAKGVTPFLELAGRAGAIAVDGVGMLVEQAAESFFIWRGIRPDTRPVIAFIKAAL